MRLLSVETVVVIALLVWMQLAAHAGATDASTDGDNNPCSSLKGTLSSPPPSRYDPLACWLWKLHLTIPDQSFHKTFLSLSVEDMTCTNFTVSSIISSYLPSTNNDSNSSNSNPSLDIQVHGIAATCQGRYRATPGLGGTVQVHIDSDNMALLLQEETVHDEMLMESPPPLHLVWTLLSNSKNESHSNDDNHTSANTSSSSSFHWPSAVLTTTCDTQLRVPSHGGIHFYGSISAQMINWFSGSIANYVSDALSTQLCPILVATVDPALSHVLQQAQTYLQHVIPTLSPPATLYSTDDNKPHHNKHRGKSETAQLPIPPMQPQFKLGRFLTTKSSTSSIPSHHHHKNKKMNANNTTTSVWLNFTKDTPVLTSALTLLNDVVLKRYLKEGLLLHWWNRQNRHVPCHDDSSCGWLFGGINSMIRSLLSSLAPNDADALCLHVPKDSARFSALHNITFLIPRYGRVLLAVKRVCIQGLDQMDIVQLFRPMIVPEGGDEIKDHDGNLTRKTATPPRATTTSFDTNFMTRRGWNVTTQLHVTVQSIPGGIVQGPDLEEEFQLQVNIRKGEIGTSSGLPRQNHSTTNAAGLMVRIRRDLFRQIITVGLLEDAITSLLGNIFGKLPSDHEDKPLWPCFLAPLESIHFPSLLANLTMGSISLVPVDNYDTTRQRKHQLLLQRSKANAPVRDGNNGWVDDENYNSRGVGRDESDGSRWFGGESLEEDVDALLNHVLQLFLNEYRATITAALAGVTAGPLRLAVNRWFKTSLQHWKQPTRQPERPLSFDADDALALICNGTYPRNSSAPSNTLSAAPYEQRSSAASFKHLVNRTHLHLLESFNRWLQRNYTIEGINEYLNCASSFISNNILPLIDTGLGTSLTASRALLSSKGLVLRVRNARLSNIGSLDQIEVMAPVSNLDGLLESRLDYATCNNAKSLPELYAEIEMQYPAIANLSAYVNLTLYLRDVRLNGSISVLYDHDLLRSMMLSDVLLKGHCAISVPTSEVQIPESMGWISVLGLNISGLVTTTNTPASDPVKIDLHYQDAPTAAISSVLNWALLSIRDWVNVSSDSLLSESQQVCKGTKEVVPVPADNEVDHDVSRWIFLGVGILAILLQPMILMLVKDRRSRPVQPDSRDRELAEPLLSPLEDLDETKMHALEEFEETEDRVPMSLMMNLAVPELIRVLLPMFIIGTIALLVSSNVSVGASVNLLLSGPSAKEVKLPPLFAFSLGNTILQMYHAGIYPLMLLVVVFSGIWPYLKLLLMLLAWLVPIQTRSMFQRKQLLLALDAFGKFSLVDTYVLVLMMVAFRYHLQLTEEMAVDVFVTPLFGFYGFLAATSASLVAGHAMIYFHRRGEFNVPPSSQAADSASVAERHQSVMQHEYYFHDNADDGTVIIRRKRLRLWVRAFFMVMATTTVVFLMLGVTRKCFMFEFGGLAGMSLGDDQRRVSYSLVSLGAALPGSVPKYYGAGIRLLQTAYYFYALVTPFTCLTLVMVLWSCPLSLRYQCWVVTFAEIANAWSAIEVFVLSMVAALLEISTFCSFIIGHKCDLINEFVSKYLDKALANPNDHTCYSVQASVAWNCWYLIAGSIMYSFLVSAILRFAHSALDDRRLEAEEISETARQVGGNFAVLRHTEKVHDQATMIGCLSRSALSQWVFALSTDENTPTSVVAPTAQGQGREGQQQYWARWREVCSVT